MNGWYYDTQLENELTSVSLHPNKIWNDTSKMWVDTENDGPNKGDGERYRRDLDYHGYGYRLKPIARSILTEDFNVSVANNWSNINGDDVISGLWGGFRALSPYMSMVEYAGEKWLDPALEENPEDGSWSTAIKERATKFVDRARKMRQNLSTHINDQLVVQGTRFAFYAGSGTAFGNLGMKFTMFPLFDDNEFKSVVSQAKELLLYSNGQFKGADFEMLKEVSKLWAKTIADTKDQFEDLMQKVGGKFDSWTNKLAESRENKRSFEDAANYIGDQFDSAWNLSKAAGTSISNDVASMIMDRDLIAWQTAPGGYVPSYRDINEAIEGTLKLRIGTQYAISSLLCQDATLNFSKTMVKNPYNGDISPLYCDVNLTLTPASKFANNRLLEFIGATGTRNIYKNEISTTLGNKLQAEKNRIEINYNNV